MPAKTPKSWKPTEECIERITTMHVSNQWVSVRLKTSSEDEWWWEIIIHNSYPRHNVRISQDDCRTFDYQDEAANAAYKWAHKHLRPKRRKKRHHKCQSST